jgi:hypothetical protein
VILAEIDLAARKKVALACNWTAENSDDRYSALKPGMEVEFRKGRVTEVNK